VLERKQSCTDETGTGLNQLVESNVVSDHHRYQSCCEQEVAGCVANKFIFYVHCARWLQKKCVEEMRREALGVPSTAACEVASILLMAKSRMVFDAQPNLFFDLVVSAGF
jgi:hypothetical protein